MAFRDYDFDGDNDLLDEIIEEDLFCEDDPELEEHFVSLHKTLSSPKPKASSSYHPPGPFLQSSVKKYDEYMASDKKPTKKEVFLSLFAGGGFMFFPPVMLITFYNILLGYISGCFFAFWLMRMLYIHSIVDPLEKNGYMKYLLENQNVKGFKEKIEAFQSLKSSNETQLIIWLVASVVGFIAAAQLIPF